MTKPISERKLRDEFQKLKEMDHLCAMGKDEGEILEILSTFLLTGLSNNEKTICIVDKKTKAKILARIKQESNTYDNVNTHLEFIVEEEIFHTHSNFDSDRVIHLLNYIIEKTPSSNEFKSLRIIVDYSWILQRKIGKQKIKEFEAKIKELTIEKDSKTLCLYNEATTDSTILLNVLLNHSKTVLQSKMCENILFNKSNLFNNKNQEKLSQDLYNSITQHLLNSTSNSENIYNIKERAEEEIQKNKEKSELLYKNLFENTGTAMILTDTEFSITLINSKCEELLGYTKEEVEGIKNWSDFIVEEDAILIQQCDRRGKKNEILQHDHEVSLITKSRKLKNVEYTISQVPEKNQLILSITDITCKKLSENELKENEEKYRNFVENFEGIAFRGTIDFKLIYFQGSVEEITGYTEKEFIHGDLTWDQLIIEEDLHIPLSLQENLQSDLHFQKIIEYRIRHKNGEIKWIRQNIKNIRDEKNDSYLVQGSLFDITKEKDALNSLTKSERNYRTLIETSPDAVLLTNLEGTIIFANNQATELLGFSSIQDLLSTEETKDGFRYYAKDSINDLQRNLEETLLKGSVINYEYQMIKKDGTSFPAEISTTLMIDNKGSPYAIMVVGRDISERKNTAVKLINSEEKYRSLVDSVKILICKLDLDGTTNFVNHLIEDIAGYLPEEVIGKNWWDLLYPGKLYNQVKELSRKLEISEVSNFEMTLKTRTGDLKTISWSSFCERDEHGKLIEINGTGIDITKKIESEKALKKSEEKYRLLFQNANDAIFLQKLNGTNGTNEKFVEVNDIACLRLGYTKEELLELSSKDIDDPSFGEKHDSIMKNLLEEGQATFERLRTTKKGDRIPVEVSAMVVNFDEEKMVLSISREIKERKENERILQERESMLTSIIRQSPRGFVAFKEKENITITNPALELILGYSHKELKGKSLITILHPEDRVDTIHEFERIAKKEVSSTMFEKRFIHKNGSIIFGSVVSWGTYSEKGSLSYIFSFIDDITEKKKLDEERKLTENQLLLMKHSLDSSLSGIVISDMQRNISYVNRALLDLWGYEHPDEIIGKNVMDTIPYSYTDDADFQKSKESMDKTGQWAGDVEAKKRDDTPFWTRMFANFVYDSNNIPIAMMLSFIDITYQKDAEEALRISEEKSRRIIENSPIGIMISSVDGFIMSANLSAVNIFGYDSEENFISTVNTFGADKKLYAYPESRNQFVSFISDGKKWYKDENQFVKKDGTIITLRVISHLTVDNIGQQIIETFIEDVTENKRIDAEREKAVQALLRSEEKLTVLNEELEEKVKKRTFQMENLYSLNRDVYLSSNIHEAMEVISNYLENHGDYNLIMQIIEQERLNHIHVNSSSVDKKNLDKMIIDLKTEFGYYKPSILENRDEIVLKSISKRSSTASKEISSNLSVPLLVDENIIGFILIGSSGKIEYSEDEIWFIYRLADNISQTLEHLKAILTAKEELETVLNHSSNGIILLNENRDIVMSNAVGKEIIKILGIEESKNISDSTIDIDLLLDEMKQELNIQEQTFIVELSIIKTDYVHGMLLNIQNETDERKMQRLIMQQERLAIVGQLTGGVAHDFNNILASIIGAADFAMMNLENLESRELLNLIIRQSERGAALIRQMLDFTRQTVVKPKPLNIQSFVDEISRVLRASLTTNIALNVSNSLSTVLMDPIQLQQLLMNLVFNSRDAMPDGGEISLNIQEVEHTEVQDFEEVEIDKNHIYVHFKIEDDGVGMNQEVLKKAFEPFYTTKGPGKGSGLGLSQVYGIVRQSNGYISIQSENDVGTTVHFYIPKFIGDSVEELEEVASRGKGRVSLVEDDDDVRDIVKIMLENYGYDVIATIHGKAALEVYDNTFDLVLTDIMMPVMGGNELIEELLRSRDASVKCLAMTGYADVQVPKGIEVIHKPMTSSKLVNHVQDLIENPNSKLKMKK